MIKIEKIANGFIVIFNNTDNLRVKLYFPTYKDMETWLSQQFNKGE